MKPRPSSPTIGTNGTAVCEWADSSGIYAKTTTSGDPPKDIPSCTVVSIPVVLRSSITSFTDRKCHEIQ